MKILFRNVFSFLTIGVVTLGLAACGGGGKTSTTAGTTQPSGTTTTNGDSTITTTTEAKETFDLGGVTVKILSGAPHEMDPFDPNFSGKNQSERQLLQQEVEKNYNVKIKYEIYGTGAEYGSPRINSIIQGVLDQNPMGHIYLISSTWIGTLAEANAIAPVKSYIYNYANKNYDPTMKEFGAYKDNIYGFSSGYVLNDKSGIYFNLDLVEELGIESPAEKWNKGEWTWDAFTQYVTAAQAALAAKGSDYYAIGGVEGLYAENMIPANGGYLINPSTKKVAFDQPASLATYAYLTSLRNKGVWEPAPAYDAGSPSWLQGKVLMHPGELWFLGVDNRWGTLDFDLGYVPYPLGNGKVTADYKIGKGEEPMMVISAGFEKATHPTGLNDEMIFRIWNDLQRWETYDNIKKGFETTLEEKYNDEDSIAAHLSVLDKIYVEQIFNLYSGTHSEYGFYTISNKAIREGDANTYLSGIKPTYQDKLDALFGGQ